MEGLETMAGDNSLNNLYLRLRDKEILPKSGLAHICEYFISEMARRLDEQGVTSTSLSAVMGLTRDGKEWEYDVWRRETGTSLFMHIKASGPGVRVSSSWIYRSKHPEHTFDVTIPLDMDFDHFNTRLEDALVMAVEAYKQV
jgi:hypothetical protein